MPDFASLDILGLSFNASATTASFSMGFKEHVEYMIMLKQTPRENLTREVIIVNK